MCVCYPSNMNGHARTTLWAILGIEDEDERKRLFQMVFGKEMAGDQ